MEDEALAKLRAKITTGKKTLKEVYGAPMRGIVTGLNDAFVIDTSTRDRLVKADPKSAELLKPFLKGENVKRWRVESDGLWLINIPFGFSREQLFPDHEGPAPTEAEAWKVFGYAYPALAAQLSPFAAKARIRSDQGQYWWELRACSYLEAFAKPKIIYQDICNSNPFTLDVDQHQAVNTCYFVQSDEPALLGYLNSNLAWFFWSAITNIARGGYLRLRTDFVETTPVSETITTNKALASISAQATRCAIDRRNAETAFHTRLLTDLAKAGTKLNNKLRNFHELNFTELQAEIKRALKGTIPVKERREWQALHDEASSEIHRLNAEISVAEAEINRLVYKAFELTGDEIELLENSLKGQV